MTKMYLVCGVEVTRQVDCDIDGVNIQEMKLSWSEGMVGVMPVFDNMEVAVRYAGDRLRVLEVLVEEVKPEEEDAVCN